MTIPNPLNRVTVKDRAFLSRQLATMLSSGIAITEAMKILLSQTKNPVVRQSIVEIIHDLEAGMSFSAAIDRQPKLFNSIYVAMVRAGETTGKLEEVLLQLADNVEKDSAIVGKIRGAMLYPAFIIMAMIVVAILMMVKVIPQLTSIFKEGNATLPISTRVLIAASNFFVHFWLVVVVAAVIVVFLAGRWLMTVPGTMFLNQLQLRIPGISESLYMSRFTQTISMLIKSGVPIVQALDITADVMNNYVFKDALIQAKGQLERGNPLSTPIGQNPHFPKIVSQMILVGEQTGKLDQIMEKLSLYYEDDLDTKIKSISTLIEPIIIVILGISVAFLVMAILLPIYNIAQIS